MDKPYRYAIRANHTILRRIDKIAIGKPAILDIIGELLDKRYEVAIEQLPAPRDKTNQHTHNRRSSRDGMDQRKRQVAA